MCNRRDHVITLLPGLYATDWIMVIIATVDTSREQREGCAMALESCSELLDPEQVQMGLDFLLSHGLADDEASVREKMIAAGVKETDAACEKWTCSQWPAFHNERGQELVSSC